MTKKKLLDWAQDILAKMPTTVRDGHGIAMRSERVSWLMAATSFVEACLPEAHAIRKEINARYVTRADLLEVERFERMKGLFLATMDLVQNDRLESLIDSVRVQTESEVLDIAFELFGMGHLLAATVLGGGALEVHLRRLYEKTPNAQPLKGDPSIGKYDNAISATRNAGHGVPYEPIDSKSIQAWAGLRNVAAHTPTTATATEDQVRLARMIHGAGS